MKRKKCEDGKNCGATCINRSIVCRVDLGAPLSGDLSNVSKRVESAHLEDSPTLEVPVAGGREFMEPYRERFRLLKEARERATSMISLLKKKSEDGEFDTKKREELWNKTKKFLIKESNILAAESKLMREIRDKLMKTNLSDEEVKKIVDRVTIKSDNPSIGRIVRDDVEEFVRMFNGRGVVKTFDDPATPFLKLVEVKEGARAYADHKNNSIRVEPYGKDTFHELGHFVEFQSKSLYDYAKRWRDSKALTMHQILFSKEDDPLFEKWYSHEGRLSWSRAGEGQLAVYKLNRIINGYDDTEEVFMGRYMHPYMGKIYEGRPHTEVISMALQHFVRPAFMIDLYRNHPDLFEMAVGLAITPAGN